VSLKRLLSDIRACQVCAPHLPLGARPVVHAAASARLLIVGQAPGRKVHETGVPWNDASGERLRAWMQTENSIFYDESKVAIIPMGFCYPGAAINGGDNPPRPECAPLWHDRLIKQLPNLELTLLVGQYAQRYYLGRTAKRSMTETVDAFAEYGPRYFPLPHPSWRTTIWIKKNSWFEEKVLPRLREAVQKAID
jgi:uracil-DNA glycosylase